MPKRQVLEPIIKPEWPDDQILGGLSAGLFKSRVALLGVLGRRRFAAGVRVHGRLLRAPVGNLVSELSGLFVGETGSVFGTRCHAAGTCTVHKKLCKEANQWATYK